MKYRIEYFSPKSDDWRFIEKHADFEGAVEALTFYIKIYSRKFPLFKFRIRDVESDFSIPAELL